MSGEAKLGTKIFLGTIGLLAWGATCVEAGGWLRRRAPAPAVAPRPAVVTQAPRPAAAVSPLVPTSYTPSQYPMLGTFYPSPYLMVRGNWPAGGGYSPLGIYGDASMAVNGPLSPFRTYTAPVVTYARGYDGRPVAIEGTSFSTPNRPEITPVVYPTQANYFYRIREPGDPPWWANGMDWIDQN
jgi:hypothetical protein